MALYIVFCRLAIMLVGADRPLVGRWCPTCRRSPLVVLAILGDHVRSRRPSAVEGVTRAVAHPDVIRV
jgi:hypothetical protein